MDRDNSELSRVVKILQRLVRFPTITPQECGIFDYICDLLPDFNVLKIEKDGVKNLFLYHKFGDGDHWCLAGHIDVVPPGVGWERDPFGGEICDGFLYGRGAQDMKSGVAAMVSALLEISSFESLADNSRIGEPKNLNAKNLVDSGIGTLSLLLTSDEEGEAKYGTLAMLDELRARDLLPDFAIVTEPTSEVRFGDTIKVGRRGSINGTIKIHGKQGHVAYPKKCINPLDLIAPKLSQISGFLLDNGDEFFEPSRLVITDIRGGIEAVNVTPESLRIMFNIRNSTKTSIDDVREYLEGLLHGIAHELVLNQSSKPFVTARDSRVVDRLVHASEKVCGIAPTLSSGGGTSDARYFAEFGVAVAELGVVNDRIHALNERVKLREVEQLERVLLCALFGE